MATKEDLHRLVDQLAETEADAAMGVIHQPNWPKLVGSINQGLNGSWWVFPGCDRTMIVSLEVVKSDTKIAPFGS